MYKFVVNLIPKFIRNNIYNIISNCKNFPRIINISLKKNKKVYIIRRKNSSSGFFSNFLYVLGHIIYCEQKQYIPVVDMENYLTLYNEKEEVFGTLNSWEYYFSQPNSGITLSLAYSSPNTILSATKYFKNLVGVYEVLSEDKIHMLNNYINKYIHIRKELLEEFEEEFERKMGSVRGKILAVHIRGTDMLNTINHPKPPTIETYIKEVNKILADKSYTDILLCTDDDNTVLRFEDYFGKIVKTTDSLRSSNGINPPHKLKAEREYHNFKLGKEVLRDMYFLSKADSLICCYSNVSYVAIIFNNCQYEKIINLAVFEPKYNGAKKLK